VLLKQYDLGCLAHASYLIADEASGIAAVVDPQRNIDQYLQDAAQLGLDIRYVFLTHFHADFLAGHLELRERVAATICLGTRVQCPDRRMGRRCETRPLDSTGEWSWLAGESEVGARTYMQ
jgi:glyoxylase-like metal-dependent hydrolase (beta-lactamase superfamily II)